MKTMAVIINIHFLFSFSTVHSYEKSALIREVLNTKIPQDLNLMVNRRCFSSVKTYDRHVLKGFVDEHHDSVPVSADVIS